VSQKSKISLFILNSAPSATAAVKQDQSTCTWGSCDFIFHCIV